MDLLTGQERTNKHDDFDVFFNCLPSPVWLLSENNEIRRINRAGCELILYWREFCENESQVQTNEVMPYWLKNVLEIFHRSREPECTMEQRIKGLGYFQVTCRYVSFGDKSLGDKVILFHDITAQRQIRSALRRYRILSEYARDIILFVGEDGGITEANQAAVEAYGYNRDELLSMTIYDLRKEQHRLSVPIQMNAASKEGVLFETEHVRKDGSTFPVEVSSRGIVLDGDPVLLSIVRDITQRKADEEIIYSMNQKLEDIIEFLPDATFVVDNDSRVISWNQAMEELTGIPKDEIIGKTKEAYCKLFNPEAEETLINLVDQDDPSLLLRYEHIKRKGKTVFVESYAPALCNRKGAYAWAAASPLYDRSGNKTGAIECIRDITHWKQREWEIRYNSMHDYLTKLYNRSHFEMQLKTFDRKQDIPVGMMICDVDGLKLVNDTLGHQAGDNLLVTAGQILQNSIRKGDTAARIGGDEFALLLPGAGNETMEKVLLQIKNQIGDYNRANAQFPLSISIGYSIRRGKHMKMDDLFKMADNRMYQEKLYHNRSTYSGIIKVLMKTLEEKDIVTSRHSDRMQHLMMRMAKAVGLSNQSMSNLRLLAQFHDIGKIVTPEAILKKKGPLTREERMEIQKHCIVGYRIAFSVDSLAPIADWILKHHEWWNGQGYPNGLAGEDIPLECRILTIADAYDAMTSDRPYRAAMSPDKAVKELIRCAGSQFDPDLVQKFLTMLDESVSLP